MLLETLEENNEGIIVYSRNALSTDDNFRMLLKKGEKSPKKLFIYDVCELINNNTPKNLIAYRLLTNIEDLTIKESKYGCIIRTNEGDEIIYPDPIYAFQELENIMDSKYLPQLNFRLQQVGFTTEPENNEVYRELFHFDLNAKEAQAQNDTAFIETLQKILMEDPLNTPNIISKYLIYEDLSNPDKNINEEKFISAPGYSLQGKDQKRKEMKSVFRIFNSLRSLIDYIKPGKRRKIFLRFMKF